MIALAIAMACGGIAIIAGGLLVAVYALVRMLLRGPRPLRLTQSRTERRLLIASVVTCIVCAVVALPIFLPEKAASDSAWIQITSYEADGTTVKEVLEGDKARAWQRTQSRSVIILFMAPVVISLFPFMLYALSIRPMVEAAVAVLMAAQIAIGMSGYGLVFVPAALLMLLAAISALRTNEVQSGGRI